MIPTMIWGTVMDTSEFYVRQLLIRAAAAGERIAVYSYDPRRWDSVSQPNIAVVERGRPAEFVPTIIVNDVSFANASWGSRREMATLKRLEANLQILPLLFLIFLRHSLFVSPGCLSVYQW